MAAPRPRTRHATACDDRHAIAALLLGAHRRFSENKMVREGGIRFYCGTPLIASNGHRLGTL